MEALPSIMASQTKDARERLVHGLVTAKVRTRESDGTFRLEYLSMGDGEPSAPARMMAPMAGGKRGTYFFPEPGDEVIVCFEHGNTNMPVILGAVWNQDDVPPSQAKQSADNNIRTIVSRSGHELTFDDTAGAGKIIVKTQSGHTLTLDDAPAAPKITLTTAGGRTLVLDDSQGGQAVISTPSGVKISMSDSGGTMSLVAPLQISLESMMISMKANIIEMLTTGTPSASMVIIDSVPFGLHTHLPAVLPPLGTTGIVGPPGG
jgi:phage baseplate assembly protein gpV